mmetsp:Transcript_27899/g.44231  ORF Transcript_27899/g.44231 Transcript_27899/m.44231 type:complete len:268 (-) Transcript_27899:224-1027(-)
MLCMQSCREIQTEIINDIFSLNTTEQGTHKRKMLIILHDFRIFLFILFTILNIIRTFIHSAAVTVLVIGRLLSTPFDSKMATQQQPVLNLIHVRQNLRILHHLHSTLLDLCNLRLARFLIRPQDIIKHLWRCIRRQIDHHISSVAGRDNMHFVGIGSVLLIRSAHKMSRPQLEAITANEADSTIDCIWFGSQILHARRELAAQIGCQQVGISHRDQPILVLHQFQLFQQCLEVWRSLLGSKQDEFLALQLFEKEQQILECAHCKLGG